MMDSRLRGRYNTVLLFIIFIINPFFACISSVAMVKKGNPDIKMYFAFIALFIGLLAFTQYSPNGDISRTYHIINSMTSFSFAQFFIYLFTEKYLIFTALNVIIAKTTGNVQYTSLLWGFLIYYMVFSAVLNLEKYFGCERKKTYMALMAALFCFVIFVEAMETMKQALGTSFAFYSFTCYLLKQRVRCIVSFVLSLGMHFSPLFLLPLFFVKMLRTSWLYAILLISFSMRGINLMELTAQILNGLGFLPAVASVAESYTEQNYNNFFSDAPYFQFTFWMLCLIVLLNNLFVAQGGGIIGKASIIFIIILNLNYSNNHNFTRLLLFSFPVYIMIFMNFLCHLKEMRTRRLLTSFMISVTFFLQFWFSFERFGTDPSKYQTSFMDNSLTAIAVSPVYSYLSYKVPVD